MRDVLHLHSFVRARDVLQEMSLGKDQSCLTKGIVPQQYNIMLTFFRDAHVHTHLHPLTLQDTQTGADADKGSKETGGS